MFVDNNHSVEFLINDIIIVPDIGAVLTGVLKQGKIKIGNKLLIGPCDNTFYTVTVTSIHKKQIPSKYIYCGELGTIVIQSHKINITKHMMLITQDQMQYFKKEFTFSTTNIEEILADSKYMAFCRNIYDSVIIKNIKNDIIYAEFSKIQYIKENEFIILKKNDKLIFGKIIN